MLKNIFLLLGISCTGVSYAAAVFNVTPSSTSVSISTAATTSVTWTVHNNAGIPLPAVSVAALTVPGATLTSNTCASSLAANGSCTFTTLIAGSALSANNSYLLSPAVCAFHQSVCSISPTPVMINVTAAPASNGPFTYVTTNTGELTKTTYCYVTGSDYSSLCTETGPELFAGPMALDSTAQNAYILTGPGGGYTEVEYCSINSNGSFNTCGSQSYEGFTNVGSIAIGSNYAYIASRSGSIKSCPITSGVISGSCASTTVTADPLSIAIGPTGDSQHAFFTTVDGVKSCPIGDGVVSSSCSTAGSSFSTPVAIAINQQDSVAYVANQDSTTITECNVSGGDLTDCTETARLPDAIASLDSVAVNSDNTVLYVGADGHEVYYCPIIAGAVQVDSCVIPAGTLDYSGLAGLAAS